MDFTRATVGILVHTKVFDGAEVRAGKYIPLFLSFGGGEVCRQTAALNWGKAWLRNLQFLILIVKFLYSRGSQPQPPKTLSS